MQGKMMHRLLRIIDIPRHAAQAHGQEGILSARVEDELHRQNCGQSLARAAQLAHALTATGRISKPTKRMRMSNHVLPKLRGGAA